MKNSSTGLIRFLSQNARAVKHAPLMMGLIVLVSVISGGSNAALLAMINHSLSSGAPSSKQFVIIFFGLCFLLPVSRFVSEVMLINLSSRAMLELRVRLSRQILSAPLRRLEELGTHRLLATLTDDVPTIGNTLVNIPILSLHISIVAGCLIYLGWLSRPILLGVLGFMVVGSLSYLIPLRRGTRAYNAVREQWDKLFNHFQAVTSGVKELKLHHDRREAFLSKALYPTAAALRRHAVTGHLMFVGANSWGQALFFILIGLILFATDSLSGVNTQTLIGYTLVILYMMTPLQMILTLIPTFATASVAMRKVEKMGLTLHESVAASGETARQLEATASWQNLELVGVTHTYHREGEPGGFILGPINLKLEAGELLFITGGNGSGKTTLAKLLLGLYVPEEGEVYLDGKLVTDETREQYRQLFSVVFSDFYLFESLFGLDSIHLDANARNYLVQLQLEHKVKVEEGTLSTIDLSQGQRKRLALLTAYLEDRPVYLFDEWAADQDPFFKEIFYHQLLPELKAKGKAIIVISHDDRYYHVADRVIKLDYGKLQPGEIIAAPVKRALVEVPQSFD
ncbi:MAG TPA: cyclic peptide export ABC transporter [Pyrinomonadaceae bacterium]|nr:cyclic peptide export ABC transporter [Pyrinomonadaceae bacterium]